MTTFGQPVKIGFEEIDLKDLPARSRIEVIKLRLATIERRKAREDATESAFDNLRTTK